ncbi:PH domain-containing protein [Streptomyces sp. NPDC051940]|uniref:PH domain-containing protein n=1 Tax=Streptomyces sp. NPDC051940 TaxID=3155675 RepID=UPI00344AC463
MSSDKPSTPPPADQPVFADRTYRSIGGIVGGVLVLALALWLGIDALVQGDGRARVLAVTALLWVVPLVVAFALRPAVYANTERMRVRNPMRTLTVPWAVVDELRSGLNNEFFADGKKYQLWAIPVSLRGRRRAGRKQYRAERGRRGGAAAETTQHVPEDFRHSGDQSMGDLRELLAMNAQRPEAAGTLTVRWAWEIIAPLAVGLVGFVVTLIAG